MNKYLAQSKQGFNWCVKGTLQTSISCSDLWAIISSPSNLELFHPFCANNPIINWPGLNSFDQIYYYNGLILERKFVNWIDGKGYDLSIGKKNEKQSFVSWKIEENKNKAKLSVSIYPYLYNEGNKMINFFPFYLIVRPSLTNYINSVMKGLEYYIETNKKVEKNQFGTHKFFSKK